MSIFIMTDVYYNFSYIGSREGGKAAGIEHSSTIIKATEDDAHSERAITRGVSLVCSNLAQSTLVPCQPSSSEALKPVLGGWQSKINHVSRITLDASHHDITST